VKSAKRRVRAVLFDFDGTLADSYAGIAASVNHVRARRGLPPLAVAEVRKHVGRGPAHLLQHTVPGADLDRDVAAYRAHHPSVMEAGTRLLPGARDAVLAVKRGGLLLAVCSNKPRPFTERLLQHLDLADFVNVVLGPEDVPRPKPDPAMVLCALDRLGVAAADALYVGDMSVDVQCARAAGVEVWVVTTGSDEPAVLQQARPDRLLSHLGELPGLLGLAD